MTLTDSSSARVGASVVRAIASSTVSFHQFMVYVSMNITSAITGAIGVVKNGAGTLTYTAICNYTGPTRINQGTINIASASTLNGIISGSGSIIKSGTATPLTLRGVNTYSGGTSQANIAITIICNANNALGTGLFTSTAGGAGTIIRTDEIITLSNPFTTSGALQFRVTSQTDILTIPNNISGNGSLNKTSNGILVLQGTNSYLGSTHITAGQLRVAKTNGAVTASATFTNSSLSVSFNTPPTSGMTFRYFPGSTVDPYISVTLINGGGLIGSYNSSNSTLTIT
jgi:fibronectin-binding autotransporter adhesin